MASSISELTSKLRNSIVDLYHRTIGKYIGSLFKKPASILFLGIDNAGKTTLVNILKKHKVEYYLPTKHSTKDEVQIGNLKAMVIDIGGHEPARVAWKDYFYSVDGIVFIVDVADDVRYAEVCSAWSTVVSLEKKAPVLIFMNKIDEYDLTPQTAEMNYEFKNRIEASTGIGNIRNPDQPVKISYISIINENLNEENTVLRQSFEWLSARINEKDSKSSKPAPASNLSSGVQSNPWNVSTNSRNQWNVEK